MAPAVTARIRLILLAAGIGLSGVAVGQDADEARQPHVPPIVLNYLGQFDYNAHEFIDSDIIDFSYLQEAPAGERGFLFAGTDGRFYFEDGTRGLFWGINVAKHSVFQSKDRIDRAVAAISRAGFNLVRLHHIDDVDGLLPPERSGKPDPIDPEKLDAVDYWVYRLKEAGIYVYLDLLDFRTFTAAEGVQAAGELGRAAKPYAVFDNTLIELQIQYARRLLLDHVNPYTGLSYANDPAIAMIELCDEHGLYMSRRRWGNLVEPYASNLRRQFNDWLMKRYGSTAMLAEAWTDAEGDQGLLPGERLEESTVWLFPEKHRPDAFSADEQGNARLQRGRAADRKLFINHVHSEYLRRVGGYLKRRGVRVPMTAILDFNDVADMRTVADGLDFMGTNFYYDHPNFRAGNEWRLPAFHDLRNPIEDPRTETFIPRTLVSRVWGKPSVVREWNVCWPNPHRAVGMVEAAAYAALQDIDAVILFTYDVLEHKRRVEFFDVRTDPARWSLMGLCAKIFLSRHVAPARHRTALAFSRVDSFYPTWQPMPTESYKLGWVSGFSTLFFDEQAPTTGPDLLMASGRSASGAYTGNNVIICSNWEAEDLLDHKRDRSLEDKSGYQIATVPGDHGYYTFGGTMFPARSRVRVLTDPAFHVADVEARGLRPIGIGAGGEGCVGFRDTERNAYVFRRLTDAQKLRVALDALGHIYGGQMSHAYADTGVYVSDTGQIVRDTNAGVLCVDAPHAQVIAGNLSNSERTQTKRMRLRTPTATGALVWSTLDRRPPNTSQRWVLKMVSVAENTGQQTRHHFSNAERTIYALDQMGDSPISTRAEKRSGATTVLLDGKEALRIGLVNGSWELVYEHGKYYFTADTGGIDVSLPGAGRSVRVGRIVEGEPTQFETLQQPFTYSEAFSLLLIVGG